MSKFVILENVADERGESAAKVARTLVRLGCDLYLRFGPSREPRTGVNFFPEHPNGGMEHNIGPGDHPLTKDSQEVVIKRLGRGDFTTLGLFVWIYTKVDSSITVPYQIELTKKDESICVVVAPDDVAKLPPPSQIEGTSAIGKPNERKFFFPDKFFHELVIRSITAVISETKNTNWLDVKRGLKNQCNEGESIQFVTGYNEEGDSVQYICFKAPEYFEPYKIRESYFKKTLSEYRKRLKHFKK